MPIKRVGADFERLDSSEAGKWGEIYKITGPGDKVYIGQAHCVSIRTSGAFQRHGASARIKQHEGNARDHPEKGCRKLNYAIRRHGHDAFTWEVLCRVPQEELNNREETYIAQFNSVDRGYNIRSGGNNARLSDETKELMSLAQRGEKHRQFGKHCTDIQKQRISDTLISNNKRVGHDGKPLPLYVKYINHVDRKGYAIVSHPNFSGVKEQKKKEFVSGKLTMDDKLKKATEFLTELEISPAAALSTKQNREGKGCPDTN